MTINYQANATAAAETAAAVTAAGGQAVALPGDVTAEAEVVGLFDAAAGAIEERVQRHGRDGRQQPD